MLYLHILNGVQAGSNITLKSSTRYTISSDFGADIFIKFEDNLKFECFFDTTDYGIIFAGTTHDIVVKDEPILLNESYELPLYCDINGIKILFSLDSEPSLNELTSDIRGVVIEDESEVAKDNLVQKEKIGEQLEPTEDELSKIGVAPIDLTTGNKNSDSLSSTVMDSKENSLWNKISVLLKLSYLKNIFLLEYKKLKAKLGYWLYIVLGMIGLLILGLIILISQLGNKDKVSTLKDTQIDIKSQIQQKFLQLPRKYSSLKINLVESNYVIRGMVAEDKDIKELEGYFKSTPYNLKFKVSSFIQVKPQLVKLLEQAQILNLNVNFNVDSGSINVSGIIGGMERLEDTEIAISNKLPDVGYIDTNKVFLLTDINDSLAKIIENGKYNQRLGVDKNLNHGVINISGYLSSKDMDAITKDVEAFNSKYLGVVRINLDIKDISKALPFSITEVHTGNPAWIVTNDGIRTFLGGDYKGFNLYFIDDDKIILKGKFTIAIKINDLVSPQNVSNLNNKQTEIYTSRQSILDSEMEKERIAIKENESLLQHLQHLESKTTDEKLKSSLKKVMSGVVEDLSTKKQEYHYYWSDKKES